MKIRAAVIFIYQNKTLLVRREKKVLGISKKYFCFPGGKQEFDESLTKTAIREISEELNFEITDVQKMKLFFESTTLFPGTETIEKSYYFTYYLDEIFTAKLNISSPEFKKRDEVFEPVWVNIELLGELNILPKEIKEHLIKNTLIL